MGLGSNHFRYSLQRSLPKEEDIKRRYEAEMQKLHTENVSLTDQLQHALLERNVAVQERNCVIQERNTLALQMQQEYERAERQGTVILSCHLCFCILFRIHMLLLQT